MPQPDDESQEALQRLQDRLDTFEGQRSPKAQAESAERSMGEGYRILGELIGGVFGGLGLGWVVDYFAHTTPFGMVIGLLLGTGASTYAVVKTAEAMGRRSAKKGD
jgi:ATP synthase protein I